MKPGPERDEWILTAQRGGSDSEIARAVGVGHSEPCGRPGSQAPGNGPVHLASENLDVPVPDDEVAEPGPVFQGFGHVSLDVHGQVQRVLACVLTHPGLHESHVTA